MIQLMNGDCLKLMKEIPDESVDMVLCDLPYGTTACKWDCRIQLDALWPEYKRIVKPRSAIVLFGSQPFTSILVSSNLSMFKYSWIWEKNRATGHVHAKNRPMKKHEDICVFSKGTTVHEGQSNNRMIYNPQGLIKMPEGTVRKRNDLGDDTVLSKRKSHHQTEYEWGNYPTSILKFDVEIGKGRYHQAQKPVALLEYLIRTYTFENDTVLDNCMGSASTGVACINTGRNFIGIEKDAAVFEIAKSRIDNMEVQMKLFDEQKTFECY